MDIDSPLDYRLFLKKYGFKYWPSQAFLKKRG